MKQKIFFLLFCLASFRASAQTIVDPADFPVMSSPTLSNWAVYTREDHVNRKVLPTAIRALMLPIVRQPADITYTPAATGNPNDKGSFVKTPLGRIYFIDGLGNSIQTNFPYAAATIADNDVHAGVMCVPVGGWYRLSNSNTLGLPPGTLRQRVFGTLTPCTNAANPISPGQTAVVGGSGVLKVNGDPDTNPYVKAQGQHYESSIAYDTLTRQIYTYNSEGSIGNRWNVFVGSGIDTRLDTAYISSDTLRLIVYDIVGDSILKTINVPVVENVSLTAGDGIGITGSSPSFTITNTGDTNASDDITTGTTLGGDLSGTMPNPTVAKIRGRTVSSSTPTNGQVLTYNTTTSQWEPTAPASGGHTLRDDGTDMTSRAAANFVSTSTVTAALTDDSPNGETEVRMTVPTDGITATEIAANAVGSSEIAADSVGSSEIATDAVDAAEIAANAVGSSELASTAVTPGTYTNATVTLDADGRATSASSGTPPVTGTGVSGQLAYWNGLNTITGSNAFQVTAAAINVLRNVNDQENLLSVRNSNAGSATATRMNMFNNSGAVSGTNGVSFFLTNSSWAGAYQSTFGIWNSEPGSVVFATAGAEKMRVTPTGITIGSSSNALQQLHVSGNTYVSGRIGIGVTAPTVPLDILGNMLITGNEAISGTLNVTTAATNVATFSGGSTSRIIVSGTSNTGVSLQNSGGEKWIIASYKPSGTNYSFSFYNNQTSSDAMYIDGDNNLLGISTNTPTQKLDVNGNTRLRAALYDGTNSAGTSGYLLSSTGAATQWVTPASIAAAANALTTTTSHAGDVTGVYNNLQLGTGVVGATELASTAVTAGTYGSATQVPVITFDADGRATGVTNTTITDNNTNIANASLTATGSNTLTQGANTLTILGSNSSSAYKPLVVQTYNDGITNNGYYLIGKDHLSTERFRIQGQGTDVEFQSVNNDIRLAANTDVEFQAGGLVSGKRMTFDAAGVLYLPSVTPSPSSGGLWQNASSELMYQYAGSSQNVALRQYDFVGDALSVRTSNFTLGASNVFSEIIDCNTGAVTVTLGSSMREGYDYVIKCRRNATNAVTFSASGSHVLEIDGSNSIGATSLVVGAGGSGMQANYKVYHLRRSGLNIFID